MDTLSDLAIIKLKPIDSNGARPSKVWEKANLGILIYYSFQAGNLTCIGSNRNLR